MIYSATHTHVNLYAYLSLYMYISMNVHVPTTLPLVYSILFLWWMWAAHGTAGVPNENFWLWGRLSKPCLRASGESGSLKPCTINDTTRTSRHQEVPTVQLLSPVLHLVLHLATSAHIRFMVELFSWRRCLLERCQTISTWLEMWQFFAQHFTTSEAGLFTWMFQK